MVCVPCFLIPLILWIFHKFVQPWLSKIWGNSENYVTSNLTCPVPQKKKKKVDGDTKTQDGEGTSEPNLKENEQSSSTSDHIKAE